MAKAKVEDVVPEGSEETVETKPEAKKVYKSIYHYPRVKCVIESRDEQEVDLPIGLNEYQAYIQFGKEIEIPEPVYDMIKGITTIKFVKDENGFSQSKEIKKYIISKV